MTVYEHQKKRLETLQRVTPNWVDSKQVEAIYLYCDLLNLFTKQKYSVDHIIPLHNPKVCGLHNQFNLQILEHKANVSKSNNFEAGIQPQDEQQELPDIDASLIRFNRMLRYFSSNNNCFHFLAYIRWGGKVKCLFCSHDKVYFLQNKKWRCKSCGKEFRVQTQSFLSKSTLGLDKWLTCLWVLSYRKTISANALSRLFGLDIKSAIKVKHIFSQRSNFLSKVKKALRELEL